MSAQEFISEMDAGKLERNLSNVFNELPTGIKDEIGKILLDRERFAIASKPTAG